MAHPAQREPDTDRKLEKEREMNQAEKYAAIVNDYRNWLNEKIGECTERLQRERDAAIKSAECGDFSEIRPECLVDRRATLEAYETSSNALEDIIDAIGESE